MRELTDVFPDKEELAVAQAVLSAVPNDIGEWNTTQATQKRIVFNAYSNETAGFKTEKMEYCEEHKIIYRLEEAGHVQFGGCFGGLKSDTLYVKPKKE